ncbi:MAG: FecR domain-containing protein [Carboxylicivirga sp.]|nr:FecR domain-containing protein [Carboxylicivirga sp.]
MAVILALALITSLSWQFFYHSPIVPVKYYHTGIGETKEIGLPDESTVQLNSASTMIVKENFNSNNRQVILIGEAFFEVAKDKNKPFVVSTSHLNVRVLGTKFNLTSYGNDDKIVTYLEEGRVQIEGEFNNGTEKTLFPGQEATLDKKSLQLIVNDKKTSKHLWTEGELMFYNSSFEDIAKVLERKYNTKIVFMDEEVMNYRFSGDFSNSNLFELMGYLTAARSFNYKAKENIVIISK